MNTPDVKCVLTSICTVTLLSLPAALSGQSVWNGDDGSYQNADNWSPAGIPATGTGATAIINSGAVIYTPGGDLILGNGGSLVMNGGSFTQDTGIAWMNVGNGGTSGSIILNGGVFNAGTSANMRIGFGGGEGLVRVAGGTFNPNGMDLYQTGTLEVTAGTANLGTAFINNGQLLLSGGETNITAGFTNAVDGRVTISGNAVVNFTGTFTPSGTVLISGGTFNVSNELKPLNADFTMTGGQINASLISFDAVDNSFDFAGGSIILTTSSWGGIYSAGDGYMNFTEGSTGELILENIATGDAAALLNGRIRYNNGIDATAFGIFEYGDGGSRIVLAGIIPEPSTYALFAGLACLAFVWLRKKVK